MRVDCDNAQMMSKRGKNKELRAWSEFTRTDKRILGFIDCFILLSSTPASFLIS